MQSRGAKFKNMCKSRRPLEQIGRNSIRSLALMQRIGTSFWRAKLSMRVKPRKSVTFSTSQRRGIYDSFNTTVPMIANAQNQVNTQILRSRTPTRKSTTIKPSISNNKARRIKCKTKIRSRKNKKLIKRMLFKKKFSRRTKLMVLKKPKLPQKCLVLRIG